MEALCLFQLLLSLETPSPDPLNIGELVKEEKPLRAIDFCYHDENEMINVVECISLCVMVVSYAADSLRAYQMLVSLNDILSYLVRALVGTCEYAHLWSTHAVKRITYVLNYLHGVS